MNKKLSVIVLVFSMVLLSTIQVFGATQNQIMYIDETKINAVISTQVSIDNTNYDLKPGQYFSVTLKDAEFDLDDNKEVVVISDSFDFEGSSKRELVVRVRDHITEGSVLRFSFYSKIKGVEARLIIDPGNSGVSAGTYVYATTGKGSISSKSKVEKIIPIFTSGDEVELEPIVITEKENAVFRSIQMYNTDDKPLIIIKPYNNAFKIRNAKGYKPITVTVDDGDNNERRYELGRDQEIKMDYDNNELTFTKVDDDIFDTPGQIYSITIENIELVPNKGKLPLGDIKLVFDGELLEEQTVGVGNVFTGDPIHLETSTQELKSGTKQTIEFKLEELIPNTLFSKGYINLGFYGGAVMDSISGFKFKMNHGNNSYTDKENKAFKLVLDPIGDRVTIEGYSRNSTNNDNITIEGTLEVTTPEDITNDIEFFINEPSLSKASIKTVLEGTDKAELPEEPKEPEIEEEIVESKGPKVKFQVDSQSYFVGETSFLLDMKPYISPYSRIMVPFRYVAYALGVDSDDLKWDGPSKMISLKGEKPMTIDAQTGRMVIDGETSTLSEIKMINGRTFVPVGEIGRAFGVKVDWNEETRTATFN